MFSILKLALHASIRMNIKKTSIPKAKQFWHGTVQLFGYGRSQEYAANVDILVVVLPMHIVYTTI